MDHRASSRPWGAPNNRAMRRPSPSWYYWSCDSFHSGTDRPDRVPGSANEREACTESHTPCFCPPTKALEYSDSTCVAWQGTGPAQREGKKEKRRDVNSTGSERGQLFTARSARAWTARACEPPFHRPPYRAQADVPLRRVSPERASSGGQARSPVRRSSGSES